jgi:hypothetical protein
MPGSRPILTQYFPVLVLIPAPDGDFSNYAWDRLAPIRGTIAVENPALLTEEQSQNHPRPFRPGGDKLDALL